MSNSKPRELFAEVMLKARERGISKPVIRHEENGELVVEDSNTGHRYAIRLVRVASENNEPAQKLAVECL